MPGLTGLSLAPGQRTAQDGAQTRLGVLEKALFKASGLNVRRLAQANETEPTKPERPPHEFLCLVLGRSPMAGTAARSGCTVAVEGYVLDTEKTDDDLAAWLLELFLDQGERFVASLRGSFQIAIHHRGSTYLYVDPVASRRLFYARQRDALLFSPEVEPLMALLGRGEVDAANLVQFLVTGRFFAGESPLLAVRQLLPGEYLVYQQGSITRRHYYRYEITPAGRGFEVEETMAEFERRLERAVLDAWNRAKNPTFLLSGGYDSRFIFYTIARALGDSSRLRTVIWGEDPQREASDTWVSGQISQRFGTRHLLWDWGVEHIPASFDAMFHAQSGMTDFAFTHVDEFLHCQTLQREHGIGSVFRGDEIFGPQKPEVKNVDEALARMGLSRRCPAEGSTWFTHGGEAYLEAHAERFDRLLGDSPQNPSDLRDTFYARERLPTFQQQLNYYRSHEVEMFNPLVDVDILRLYATLPASYRLGKRFFKMAFERQFGAHLKEDPIAAYGNAIDWTQALRRSPALVDFLRQGLEALPAPLEPSVFLAHLADVLSKVGQAASTSIPTERLLMRAFILGRWLRS